MQTYDISMLVPGMPFQGDTLETDSLGGSETAGLCMARELAALGHRVTMFTTSPVIGIYDGVTYRDISEWTLYVTSNPHDVLIVQRKPEVFTTPFASKINLLWCHDLGLARYASQFGSVGWNLDKTLVLSDYHRSQYEKAYGLQESQMHVTRNGIDLDMFKPQETRNRKQLIYSSRPERGLDNLLKDIFPRLLESDSEIKLALCGYDNPVDHMQEYYSDLSKLAERFGDQCSWLGHLTKEQLYQAYGSAGVYVYPTPSPILEEFNEISCITAMECQAAGLPIVTSKRGALRETIGRGAGKLIAGNPQSQKYQDQFVKAVLEYVNDDDKWVRASKAGLRAAKKMDWSVVAEEWSGLFDQMIAEKNDSPDRLARHFIRQSEIIGAGVLAEKHGLADIAEEIEGKYSFMNSDEEYKEHYIIGGEDTLSWLGEREFTKEHLNTTTEKRFAVIEQFIQNSPSIARVAEYGCGHGWSTIYLQNKTGRKWTAVDIDPGAIKYASDAGKKHLDRNQLVQFICGDHTESIMPINDLVICSEVLEHVRDPNAVVNSIERWCVKGGKMLVTVPYGPVEYGTYNWLNFRNHIRQFDLHDLRDMFGKKPNLAINTVPEGVHQLTNEPMGFYLVTYDADHEDIGEIDFERKLRLQAPRHSVSVNIIAGPNAEDTMRWCLKSVADIADEIVIGDTGLNEDGLKIANDYNAKIIPAPDPKKEGFETPRNVILNESKMDFIFWIDTDERMLAPVYMHKYLRSNYFPGYSIHQHHFAVDMNLGVDMPVRFFRRKTIGEDGDPIRFYGMVHEHPEAGLNKGPGIVCVLPDVNIAHIGYLHEIGRKERFARNYPLLQRDIDVYPDRVLQKHLICRDNILVAQHELAQNGGKKTENIKARAREVIDLYRKYFLGEIQIMNMNTLQYYSEANKILNQGFDAEISININRDGLGDPVSGDSVRFASKEDFDAQLKAIADARVNPFNGEWW